MTGTCGSHVRVRSSGTASRPGCRTNRLKQSGLIQGLYAMQALKRIPQRDWDNGDCGLACVAMVARVPYEKALHAFRKLKGKGTTENFHTTHSQLQEMLAHLGHKTERFRFKSWRSIEHHAIVKVNLKRSGSWHWVAFDAAREFATAHDPKPGKRKLIRDFRGLKASGFYIAITN